MTEPAETVHVRNVSRDHDHMRLRTIQWKRFMHREKQNHPQSVNTRQAVDKEKTDVSAKGY
jgi:hypothetical protein